MSNSAKGVWDLDDAALIKAQSSAKKFKLKHGMFAGIPLLCKVDDCPYAPVCSLPVQHRVLNSRCSIEIGAIMTKFDSYCRHFDINCDTDIIEDKDLVDATLIRDIVDLEVQMLRAENKIAMSGDFIGLVLADIDKNGRPYYDTAVTPESEFKNTLIDKRYKLLNQLNATRKDKAKDIKVVTGAEETLDVFKKIADKLNSNINLEGDDNGESKLKL